MKIEKEGLGEQHPDIAPSLSNIAYCYAALGNHEEASKLRAEALDIEKLELESI